MSLVKIPTLARSARNATTAFREFATLRKLPDALRKKTLRPQDG
ncbi:MAG: hypothetical protein V3T84_17540 [Phycisphaerales bacterium]